VIRRFGTWPVPLLSQNTKDGVVLQGPVCKEGQVVGWHTSEDGSCKLRRFHVAMSGFAFNSTMLWDPRLRSHLAWNSIRHPDMTKQGFEVSCLFLFQFLELHTKLLMLFRLVLHSYPCRKQAKLIELFSFELLHQSWMCGKYKKERSQGNKYSNKI
jgi:hypothetical protein